MITNRLLILDDEPMTGRLISNVAESAGFACLTTTTAKQFLEEVESWNPTHIVLDLITQDLDGVEVLAKLAQSKCHASIIIASGVGDRVLDAANRAGKEHGLIMTGVLPKPFSTVQLRALLLGKGKPGGEIAGTYNGAVLPEKTDEIITNALIRALDNDELELVYQPKINCHNDRLSGFEALVRCNCPEHGLLSPGLFIPIAESRGLMAKLTRQVIEKALTWFSDFLGDIESHQFSHDLTLSINLSPRSLDDPDLFKFVMEQCQRVGMEPRRIVFELTESSSMRDPVASLNVLTRLRVQGFQLAIDDFGTGYSSMFQLVRLPFSEIKLDQSFVRAALHSEEARVVIRSIIDLGHSLGLTVTGEGIEDVDTFKYLSQVGCDRAQGYFFSQPISGALAIDWAQNNLESCR